MNREGLMVAIPGLKSREAPNRSMSPGEAPDSRRDRIWGLPMMKQLIIQLRASWVNKKWISAQALDEIRRGN